MVDRISSERRSWNMSRIRGANTKPELLVRKAAHALGLRFRIQRRDLPGRPDVVFPKHRLVLFVHGCFWHRHEGCKKATTPSTRTAFWQEKFDANVARDKRAVGELENLGWSVAVAWECQIGDFASAELTVRSIFAELDLPMPVDPSQSPKGKGLCE